MQTDGVPNDTSAENNSRIDGFLSYGPTLVQVFPVHPSSELSAQLFMYSFGVVFTFGLTGNVLSFGVMWTRRMRRKSYSLYLATLACYDTGFLCINLLAWINVGSSWAIVIITLERLVIVSSPLRGRQFCTRKAGRIITLLLIFGSVVNSTYTSLVTSYRDDIGCYHKLQIYKIIDWLYQITFFVYLPLILVFVINTSLIILMCRSANLGQGGDKNAKTRKVTVTMLTVSCAFLVFLLPMSITGVLGAFWPDDENVLAAYDWIRSFLAINNGINFYLYVLTGAEIRLAVREMFRSCCFGDVGASSTVPASTFTD
ncbi:uncharacterized protein LOC141909239 [Tubulanus polymorphus]|uniref:uncharacterized protein LOC141909239 n=1 Tax=Tubulanus polymorphus TaxID=672921 RepID=UPI003DA4F09D